MKKIFDWEDFTSSGDEGEKGGAGRPFDPRRINLRFLKYLVVIVILLFVVKQGFYIVSAGSRGVVFRLGRVHSVTDQGINFKVPLLDRVVIVNTENIQRFEYGYRTVSVGPPARYADRPYESKMLTGDNKIVEIDWVLQFQISDPANFVVNVPANRIDRTKMIRDIAEATLRQVIASRKLDDVLTSEKEASQTEAKKMIQRQMEMLKTGIFVVAVQFQDVTPPVAVQKAFSEINSARAEKERLILEADKYANQILSKALGEAERVINEAEAYRFRRVSIAEGEAARITSLAQTYQENPSLVLNTLWLENMQQIWPQLKVLVIEGGEGTLQLLPLEGLMRQLSEAEEERR